MKLKHVDNICIEGIPKREEREQGIKNLLEEIMTKNFPNLVKEKDTSPGSSESPQKVGPKEAYTKEIMALNNTLDQMDLFDILRAFHT